MTLPQQMQSILESRAAIAPYNFVPLPEKVVPAEPDSIDMPHDRYYSSEGAKPRYTGRIACTLTTASPLYVRCGYTPEEYATFGTKPFHELTEEQKRRRAEFFHYGNSDSPTIPGSSLRGMLRALVEITSYSKMDKVTDQQLFYRDVRNAHYREAFARRGTDIGRLPVYESLVRTGFLRKQAGGYVIEECDVARIFNKPDHPVITSIPMRSGVPYKSGNNANFHPNWHFQHQTIYVQADMTPNPYQFGDKYLLFRAVHQADWVMQPSFSKGTLVITGHMQNKHMEFVFLDSIVATHSLSTDLIRRFEDDDQVTAWQEQSFPGNQPHPDARKRDGLLQDGEPVFFIMDGTEVAFFGRAQLFRRPYGSSPYEFISATVRYGVNGTAALPEIDLAEAIFGFVPQRKDDRRSAVAGRVFVSDARLAEGQTNVLFAQPLTPRVLGSPKPTTFQHYLVQTDQTQAAQNRLQGYNTTWEQTTIRGYKLYWHKDNVGSEAIREHDQQKIEKASKQYTKMQPVNSGVTFSFDIHFENLTAVELGALLWVLQLAADSNYRLKLGMGKSLGMGAVAITHNIILSNQTERYSHLFTTTTGWCTGEALMSATQAETLRGEFERYVLQNSEETAPQLADTLRMRCLLTLLTWPGPDPAKTRSMEIERDASDSANIVSSARQNRRRWSHERNVHVINEFYTRPVLPLPIAVYPNHERIQGDENADTLDAVPLEVQTVQARIGGVGTVDAAVIPLDGRKPGRARFGSSLPRKVKAGDIVLVQLNTEGRPEVIIGFVNINETPQ